MKISIIGAGNIGGLAAMRLLESGFKELVLVDVAKGLAEGKALDLEDSLAFLKYDCRLEGTGDISGIAGSDIVVITAGLTRKPGMTREDLLLKNAQILKEICLAVKKYAAKAIVIIVTNPLDLMTYLAVKILGFQSPRVIGMGMSLDAARFTRLISQELKVASAEIEAWVVGSHGEGMLPLPRLTTVKGVSLSELLDDKKTEALIDRVKGRGHEIVSLLASGSAYFAPSQAIAMIARSVAKDEKRIIGVSAYLNGEYAQRDICAGVPCRIGKKGIEQIIELELNRGEKDAFAKSLDSLRNNLGLLKPFYHGL